MPFGACFAIFDFYTFGDALKIQPLYQFTACMILRYKLIYDFSSFLKWLMP